MTFNNLLVTQEGNTCLITINRADKLNALNIETLQEIKIAVEEANRNETVRIIFLTGAGDKAFAAGADIAEFADFTVEEGTKMAAGGHEVMNTIEQSAKPVIALVNGFALGGGCELAMACHIRIASENARFGQPEINLGLVPGYAGTQRLCQLVGKSKAIEMLITGDPVKANDALQLGLCTQVVPLAELKEAAQKLAAKLSGKSFTAMASILALVNACYAESTDGFELEIEAFGKRFQTPDFVEGTNAFLEKRAADFPGN